MTLWVKLHENLNGTSDAGSPGPEHVPVWQGSPPCEYWGPDGMLHSVFNLLSYPAAPAGLLCLASSASRI